MLDLLSQYLFEKKWAGRKIRMRLNNFSWWEMVTLRWEQKTVIAQWKNSVRRGVTIIPIYCPCSGNGNCSSMATNWMENSGGGNSSTISIRNGTLISWMVWFEKNSTVNSTTPICTTEKGGYKRWKMLTDEDNHCTSPTRKDTGIRALYKISDDHQRKKCSLGSGRILYKNPVVFYGCR